MKKEELFDIIGDIDDDLIEEAGRAPRRVFPVTKILAVAACFVLIAAAMIAALPRIPIRDADEKSQIDDYYAAYGKAELITAVDPEDIKNTETYHESMSDMMAYAEKELFSHPTDIFRGEITGESYYLVDFEGVGYYYGVVTVRVDEVYRGDLAADDVVATITVEGAAPAAAAADAPAAAGAAGGHVIKTPLPGTVVKVVAAAGDTVAEGDVILVMEAMKMEQEIKADKAGVIASIDVEAGAVLAADDVVATME